MSNPDNGWHRDTKGGIEMFDKLIESDSQGAEFKNRSRYFIVSSVVVGILFLSAVVFSLYAADIGLGRDEFELSTLIAPPQPEAPEPPKQLVRQRAEETDNVRPTRQANIKQIAQSTVVPTGISSVPNTQRERPDYPFDISNYDTDPPTGGGTPNGNSSRIGSSVGTASETTDTTDTSNEKAPTPPPIIKAPVVKKPQPPANRVVNGFAIYLPKPPYPAIALTSNTQGSVDVQVTIDESGKVISAKAVNGHPFLRLPAENAARLAKFNPTLLSDVPVKVTGLIVYKFSRN